MKRYKLLRELPTFKAGDEFVLKDDGNLYLADLPGKGSCHWKGNVMAYHRNTLEHFPKILGEWFEEIHEEPKEYWVIDIRDGAGYKPYLEEPSEMDFEIGNYFETREEAELAVRKLQAWKRLKDKGFEFDSIPYCDNLCGNGFEIHFSATMPPEFWADNEVKNGLDLLFSGVKND